MSIPDSPGGRFERLRGLTEVSRSLTYATSIEEVLQLSVRCAAELMEADRALIMLADAEGQLSVRAAWGLDEVRLQRLREPLNETLISRLQGLLNYPAESCFLSVPLVVQGEVTGLLAAVRAEEAPCSPDDEWLLSALADQAAVALENARLSDAVWAERNERSRMIEEQGRAHATLGHELRSPLTAIQSYSSLLLEGTFGALSERQRESVSRIQLSGRHLLSIIENVLDAARINARTLRISSRGAPIAQVLAETMQMLQPLAAEKNQELLAGAVEPLVVWADADRLRQVLVNLIGNAIKYTPERGSIRVEVASAEHAGRPAAAVTVADTGRGISAEGMARIFEPYNRGSSSRYEPGLGLGLFISREIVRQMNGDIVVHSEPDTGSTFTVYIPLEDPATA